MNIETVRSQFARDDVGGPGLFESQFRVGMYIAANRHDLGKKGNVVQTHKFALKCRIDSVFQPGLPVHVPFRYACGHAHRNHQRAVRSGKSIALNMLEDVSYYCVDNLPSPLLQALVDQLSQQGWHCLQAGRQPWRRQYRHIAATNCPVACDRAQTAFSSRRQSETLLKRYSETRRRHPLASESRTLTEAISDERQRLASLTGLGHHIDTSELKPNALREWIRQFVTSESGSGLTLLPESFGFKHGVPLDAELVFDVRCLPGPHYEAALRPLTGRDTPVIAFLEAESGG